MMCYCKWLWRVLTLVAIGMLVCGPIFADDKQPAQRPPWTTSRLHGTPEPPEPYKIVPAFPGLQFQKPTCIEEVPGANRLLVTEISGKVFSFPKEPVAKQGDLVIDLQALLPQELAGQSVSLFDAEFHPQF